MSAVKFLPSFGNSKEGSRPCRELMEQMILLRIVGGSET